MDIYVCTYACMYIYEYTYVCMYVCMYVFMYVCMYNEFRTLRLPTSFLSWRSMIRLESRTSATNVSADRCNNPYKKNTV